MINNIELTMTPKAIVSELDRFIIGQSDAKRAVAVALRNRWRRMQLEDELKKEVTPKNILMIGPTGVGKTEIARRLAKLAKAPFIKVEATKFTEVGYVGRDVESIIRDLMDVAIKMMRDTALIKVQAQAQIRAEDRVLDSIVPPPVSNSDDINANTNVVDKATLTSYKRTRTLFRNKLKQGKLDDKEIEVDVAAPAMGVEVMGPPGMEDMTDQLQGALQAMRGGRVKKRKLKVKDALKQLMEDEAMNLIDEEDLRHQAKEVVEQNSIVFLDEIDKIVKQAEYHGGDVSREGVQRDLLPLIEGCTVKTKYGMINTDHILFITSGAFQLTKPSNLIPELQGRLPIRVELSALSVNDFVRILTEPQASLIKQYIALLATEGVTLKFSKDAVLRIAEIAYQVNEAQENIGARRLYTVMERLLDDLSFAANDKQGETVKINATYVNKQLSALSENEDLSQYIL